MTTKFLYAMHGECPKDVLTKGWIVTTHELGHDPTHAGGHDYSGWKDYGVIARLNNGYYPNGTIPEKAEYQNFAIRVGKWVAASNGCSNWIIGNEPNMQWERPNGISILPEDYAQCFAMCRQAIKILSGHENDQVLVAGIAPWNVDTSDWLWYFEKMLTDIQNLDGIVLHTYTHGSDPSLIFSEAKMNAPFDDRHYNFFAYKDFMQRIPDKWKDVPIYITETDQNDIWLDSNNGWVKNAYKEVNDWNSTHNQKIRCLALYRWNGDKYAIEQKQGVIADFLEAQALDYKWTQEPPGGEDMEVVFADGFEQGFYKYQNIGELECPIGWKPGWIDDPQDGVLDRPEYKPAGAAQVRNGTGAAAIHSRYATIDGVLMRTINVKQGDKVRASVWMLKVAKEGGHGMQVGIHPHGGENFLDGSVVWSDWYSQYEADYENNKWRQRTVETKALANVVTVFLRSKIDIKADGSNAHFDDFLLESETGGTIPPEPPTPGTGLQQYIDALRADVAQIDADIDAMEAYINAGSIRALPV